jgi:two-component system nitrogen regulation sensor histidine kinase NtrY
MSETPLIMTLPKHVAAPIGEGGRKVRMIGLVLVLLSIVSVVTSFLMLTGQTPWTPSPGSVEIALSVNGFLLVALSCLIGWELVGLYIAWKDGRAAARLHWRIIALFSLIAAAPAVLVMVLASITLDRGLDRWFETRTRTIVENAAQVGKAYLQEHARVLRGDAIAMGADIERAKPLFDFEPERFDRFLEAQCSLRQIPAAFLLKADGTVITSVKLDETWEKILMPPPNSLAQVESEEPLVIAPGQSNQVGAVIKLKDYDDLYLYATRPMDGRVLDQVRLSEEASSDYSQLEQARPSAQLAFALIFIGVTLILLLSAIWAGIGFANRLVAPIRRLILAADYVSKGNLAVQVPVRRKEGDLAHLGETFNTMTAELRTQRSELIAAKDQIDRRRRFTEAVLAGVTAGVIGIDAENRITLANRLALTLLNTAEANLLGKRLQDAIPELAPALAEALGDSHSGRAPRPVQVTLRRAGQERTIAVRITTETSDATGEGHVVTLDDITDLINAQRSSAWADVARRIAHEIKNPLTPIQLSAERIKRRYARRVEDDRQVFDQCIETIVRQVGDIERMVNEFSSFARMPKPQKVRGNVVEALRESVFLISVANPDIEFVSHLPEEPLNGRFDQRLLSQAFTNVVKNATEAISAATFAEGEPKRIDVVARQEGDEIVVEVIDNGIGLPTENRNRLLEPYVTTREKGTGLGLAIVRKIMEDHGGRIELLDAPAVQQGGRGAMMRLVLPVFDEAAGAEAGASGEHDPGVEDRRQAELTAARVAAS